MIARSAAIEAVRNQLEQLHRAAAELDVEQLTAELNRHGVNVLQSVNGIGYVITKRNIRKSDLALHLAVHQLVLELLPQE